MTQGGNADPQPARGLEDRGPIINRDLPAVNRHFHHVSQKRAESNAPDIRIIGLSPKKRVALANVVIGS